MKTRVKFIDEKYSVNKEKGVVVCILKCDLQLEKHPAYENMSYANWRETNVDWRGKFIVKGVSRCHPDDEFNETLGKRIAESKAKFNAFKTAERFYCLGGSNIEESLNNITISMTACSKAKWNEFHHLQKLIREGK